MATNHSNIGCLADIQWPALSVYDFWMDGPFNVLREGFGKFHCYLTLVFVIPTLHFIAPIVMKSKSSHYEVAVADVSPSVPSFCDLQMTNTVIPVDRYIQRKTFFKSCL